MIVLDYAGFQMKSNSPRQNTGKPQRDKKEAILDAMLGLVVERGFHDAPMSMLARRSGASPGVIYHYFPSKDDLIHAVYQRVSAAKRDVMLSGLTDEMPPREALFLIWHNIYRFYRAHNKETRFLDQYLNSPFCRKDGEEPVASDPLSARLSKLLRPRRQGGVLKDLPPEAIHSLTAGVARDLARASHAFSTATLKSIAESIWAAVSDEDPQA